MLKYSPEVVELFTRPKWQQDWEDWATRHMAYELDREILASIGVHIPADETPMPDVHSMIE